MWVLPGTPELVGLLVSRSDRCVSRAVICKRLCTAVYRFVLLYRCPALSFTGCLTLDIALGGGWARGRIVEVFGPESSGKTTLALHAIAEVQRSGGQAVLVDAENAFNLAFAKSLGVNVDVSASGSIMYVCCFGLSLFCRKHA